MRLYGGSGAYNVLLGAGAEIYIAGSGSTNVTAGCGADLFGFKGGDVGSTTIRGVTTGRDKLTLLGYAVDEVGVALAGQVLASGNTRLRLNDGTQSLCSVSRASPRRRSFKHQRST